MFSFKRVFENDSDDFSAFCISIKNSSYYVAFDQTVSVIDYKTKQQNDTIYLLALTHDLNVTQCGGFLLAGCHDKTGRVVDMKTKKTITLKGHTHVVNCIIECEDTDVLTCSWDKTIRRWNRLTGECIRTYSGHSNWVRSILYDKKTKRIFSGSDDRKISLWNVETGEKIGEMNGHDRWVSSLAFVNATTIVSGSGDDTVKIWDITTMTEIKTMSSHKGTVTSVEVTPDGQYVVSASVDHTVKVWRVATGECVATISDFETRVLQVHVSGDGRHIFAGYADGYNVYEVEPAFDCIVYEFNAQVGIKTCTLKLLTDGSIVNEKGKNIKIN